ncbi:accessory factor UbiK family protein [Tistrella mobilis]|jgi:BMFP domain-containing protein YqiC|uniref:accessory factor UbiK family protein n=1 Tax=Tistrella mobilis TaxID=171437 RepID=UPI003555E67A
MQSNNPFFDDMARVASGAMSGFAGLRQEMDQLVRSRVERMLAEMGAVTREEADALRALAEGQAGRIAALETRIAALEAAAAPVAGTPVSESAAADAPQAEAPQADAPDERSAS